MLLENPLFFSPQKRLFMPKAALRRRATGNHTTTRIVRSKSHNHPWWTKINKEKRKKYLPNRGERSIIINKWKRLEFCFCHAACWSCATERREPCQAGNRAALSGQPVRHSPPARRVTEAKFVVRAECGEWNRIRFNPSNDPLCGFHFLRSLLFF